MNKNSLATSKKTLQDKGWKPSDLVSWIDVYTPEEFHDERLSSILTVTNEDEQVFSLVQLIQQWVYGNEGDDAMGVEAQEATPSEVSGALDPSTLRRMDAWVYYLEDEADDDEELNLTPGSFLLFNDERLEVPGVNIILPFDENGLSFEAAYEERKRNARRGEKVGRGFGAWKEPIFKGSRALPDGCHSLATLHWDAWYGARSTYRLLTKKGISSGFGIDNPTKEGIFFVYQWLDFAKHFGYHGGKANKRCLLSFDLTNLENVKYAIRYVEKYGFARPIITVSPHGKSKKILGMYKGQILAALRILKAVQARFPLLDLTFPTEKGKPYDCVYKPLLDGKWKGVETHLHWTKKKTDIAGFGDQVIYMMRKDSSIADEFPTLAELWDVQNDDLWAEWEAKRDKVWTWDEFQK